jgi:hypothetical protein
MRKQYSPVKLKNPAAHGLMVRLLETQKLVILFDNDGFHNHKIEVAGDFLSVEDVTEERGGWSATISQNRPDDVENTLFLGSVNLYDDDGKRSGSVCVVSKNQNDDFITVINPKNQTCNLELNQVLEVVFRTEAAHEAYTSVPMCGELCTEQIQHFVKAIQYEGKSIVEHVFRFRFNSASVERFSEKPTGKYDGGSINFVNGRGDRTVLRLVCAWRGRSSAYKALLLPRIPSSCALSNFRRQRKQCMVCDVTLKPIDAEEFDSGCNVLLSRL